MTLSIALFVFYFVIIWTGVLFYMYTSSRGQFMLTYVIITATHNNYLSVLVVFVEM